MLKKRISNEAVLSTIYMNRIMAGNDLANRYRVKYVASFHKGEITFEQMIDSEMQTVEVLKWLRTGDFMTSKGLLDTNNGIMIDWLKENVNNYIDENYEYSWQEELIDRINAGNINVSGDLTKEDAIIQIKSYLDFLGTSLELYVNNEISYDQLPKITDFLPNLQFEIIENGVTYTVDEFVLHITGLKQSKSESFLTNCLTNITNQI